MKKKKKKKFGDSHSAKSTIMIVGLTKEHRVPTTIVIKVSALEGIAEVLS